jgi:hypothetical protein
MEKPHDTRAERPVIEKFGPRITVVRPLARALQATVCHFFTIFLARLSTRFTGETLTGTHSGKTFGENYFFSAYYIVSLSSGIVSGSSPGYRVVLVLPLTFDTIS